MDITFDLTGLAALVVSSFVSHNTTKAAELPGLIRSTYAAFQELREGLTPTRAERSPAVPIDRSVTHDYIVCLEDGKQLKTLKRYIRRKYALSPEDYRARWQLPADYPMVAPGYSQLRSTLARRGAPHAAAFGAAQAHTQRGSRRGL